MVAAAAEQRRRVRGSGGGFEQWDRAAARFRADPRRPFSADLQAIAEYVQPGDVFLDVGGGAGRYALPMALRCREAVCVDPSAGMGREFAASAREAGIENARMVESAWPAEGVTGDVALAAHVTYFVPRIRPFIEKLVEATRRRVIIAIGSVPPPNQGADLFEMLEGMPLKPVPGHRQLLPVLWDMDILPEVRLAGGAASTGMGPRNYATRGEAIQALSRGPDGTVAERTRRVVEERFEELFRPSAGGGFERATETPRLLLITWET